MKQKYSSKLVRAISVASSFSVLALALAVAIALTACAPSGGGGGAPAIDPRTGLPVPGSGRAGEVALPGDLFTVVANRSSTERIVRPNFPTLRSHGNQVKSFGGSQARLNLLSNAAFDVVFDSVDTYSDENYVLLGKIKGDTEGFVTIVVNGDVVLGNVLDGRSGDAYEIRPNDDGTHTVRSASDEGLGELPEH